MKRFTTLTVLAAALALTLVGCSRQEITGNELEAARGIAKTNATFNAELYRAANPRLEGMVLVPHTDSTIGPDCPQGDGWASISAMFKNTDTGAMEKIKLLCSTYSESMGCYREEDLRKSKTLASTDGKCADPRVVTYPLTKIAK